MFNLDWSELLIIAVIAVLVVGPKELPGMLRTIGRYVAKMRKVAGEFRTQFDQAMKEAELDGLQDAVRETRSALSTVNPVNEIKQAVTAAEASVKDIPKSIGEAAAAPAPVQATAPAPVNGSANTALPPAAEPAPADSSGTGRRTVAERAAEAWKKAAGEEGGA
jgi:sec-independent protein translocase protein TatB